MNKLIQASLLAAMSLSANTAGAQTLIADSFIFPVKATDVQNILDNISDPADGHGWAIRTHAGHWYDNRASGDTTSSCIVGFHDADDWNLSGDSFADAGAPVYAVANGRVIRVSTVLKDGNTSRGYYILIEHTLPSTEDQIQWILPGSTTSNVAHSEWNDNKVYSLSAHVSDVLVNVGDWVVKGQHVAGITNMASGPHLHFAMKWRNVGLTCYGESMQKLTNDIGSLNSRQYILDHVQETPATPPPTPVINATTPYFCNGGLQNSGAPSYTVSCNRVDPTQGYTAAVFREGEDIILNAHYTDVHGSDVLLRVFVDRDGERLTTGIDHNEGPWNFTNEPHTAYVTPIVQHAQRKAGSAMSIFRFYVCLQQQGEEVRDYESCKANPDVDSSKTVAVLLPAESGTLATQSFVCPPTGLSSGDDGFCSVLCPCNADQGPCTSNDQCTNSLTCDITASTPSGIDEGVCRNSTTPVFTPVGRYTIGTSMVCADRPYPQAGSGSLIGSYACSDARNTFYRSELISACFFVDNVYENVRFDSELWCNDVLVDTSVGNWITRSSWSAERVNTMPRFDPQDHRGTCEIRFFVETPTQSRQFVATTAVTISSEYPPAPPTASVTLSQEGQGPALRGYWGDRVICVGGIREVAPDDLGHHPHPWIPFGCSGGGVSSISQYPIGTSWHFVAPALEQGDRTLAVITRDGTYVTELLLPANTRVPGSYSFSYMRYGQLYTDVYYGHGVYTPDRPGMYAVSWYVHTSSGWQGLANETYTGLSVFVDPNAVLQQARAFVQDAAVEDGSVSSSASVIADVETLDAGTAAVDAGEVSAAGTSSLYEDFEACAVGALHGQGGWTGDPNFAVYTGGAHQGVRAVSFPSGIRPNSFVRKQIVPTTNGSQAWYMLAGQTTTIGGLQIGSNVSTNEMNITFRPSGVLAYYNGTAWIPVGTYTANQWIKMEAQWRHVDSSFRLRVNNGPWSPWDVSINRWRTVTDISLNSNGMVHGGGAFSWDLFTDAAMVDAVIPGEVLSADAWLVDLIVTGQPRNAFFAINASNEASLDLSYARASGEERIYARIHLPSHVTSAVHSAKLHLYASAIDATTPIIPLEINGVPGTWQSVAMGQELSETYLPQAEGTLDHIDSRTPGWYSFNITQLVNRALSGGTRTFGVVMHPDRYNTGATRVHWSGDPTFAPHVEFGD